MTPFPTLQPNHYCAILVDPPWPFVTRSVRGKARGPERHYACMTLEDIKALPVADIAAPNCALFMWVTDPTLQVGFDVLQAWGFRYATVGFYWVKLNKSRTNALFITRDDFFTGMGYWTRANIEPYLLATKGRPKRMAKNVSRIICAPRREHSRKPDDIYGSIERLVPGPYLELFARQSRTGWIGWGNEIGKFPACKMTGEVR